MTAETLKPFISLPGNKNSSTSSSSSSRLCSRKTIYLVWICVVIVLIAVFSCLTGYMVWNTMRISQLEKETNSLKNLIEDMQKRLGLDFLDEIDVFEDMYSKNILNDPDDSNDSDVLLDSYEDDDIEDDDLNETKNKTNLNNKKTDGKNINLNFNSDEDENGSGDYNDDYDIDDDDDDGDDDDSDPNGNNDENYDDNFYDDFEKFKNSRESRKPRSIPLSIIQQHQQTTNGYNTINYQQENDENKNNKILLKKDKIPSNRLNERKSRKHIESHRQPETLRRLPPEEYQKYLELRQKYQRSHPYAENIRLNSYSRFSTFPGSNSARQSISGQKHSQPPVAVHLILNETFPNFTDYSYQTSSSSINNDENELFYDGVIYSGNSAFDSSSSSSSLSSGFSNLIQQNSNNIDKIIKNEKGMIRIKLNGIFYVYAQIYYHNNFITNGFYVFQNTKPVLQCVISSTSGTATATISSDLYENNINYDNKIEPKGNTCFTSGIVHLKYDDLIYIRDFYKNHPVSLKDSKSFFGFIQLG